MAEGSAKIKLPLKVMLCKEFMELFFFLIFYSYFEAPRNVEKLSELIFPGHFLQAMNLEALTLKKLEFCSINPGILQHSVTFYKRRPCQIWYS